MGTLATLQAATGATAAVNRGNRAKSTFQAAGSTSSGSGAATVLIQVSNDGVNWLTIGTITLTLGTTLTSDGLAIDAPWTYVRGNVSALSGTGASVSITMGA